MLISCAEAKSRMINNIVSLASAEIGCIVDKSSTALAALVVNGAAGGVCPVDINILVNAVVNQTNAQIEQIVLAAINNTSVIPNFECCS